MFFGYVAFNQFWYTPFLRALQVANLSGMCCLSVCFGETDRVSFKLAGIATWNSTLVHFPRREARIVDGPQESVTNSGMAHATSEKNGLRPRLVPKKFCTVRHIESFDIYMNY